MQDGNRQVTRQPTFMELAAAFGQAVSLNDWLITIKHAVYSRDVNREDRR